MRKLFLIAGVAAALIAVAPSIASAARVTAAPAGAIRATSTRVFVEDIFGVINIACELTLEGEVRGAAEGTLRQLRSILIGRFTRAAVANCVGDGTMRVALLNAANIYVKEVTNRTRVELWILNALLLIETTDGLYKCLYDALLRATSRENPVERLDIFIESVLEVDTLLGSRTCFGQGFVVMGGSFTLNQRVTATLA
jgi:hypothetical protein